MNSAPKTNRATTCLSPGSDLTRVHSYNTAALNKDTQLFLNKDTQLLLNMVETFTVAEDVF